MTTIARWDENARTVWAELLQHDRSRNVEALSKCLLRLCFLLASCEMQQARYERAKQVAGARGTKPMSSPSDNGSGAGAEKRTTLWTIEQMLRQHRARLRLVACKRRSEYSDEFVFRYPGRRSAMSYYVSLCIEGPKSAQAQAKSYGWDDAADNEEALVDTGFIVREPTKASVADRSAIETLQELPDHVQLAHDSPLLPGNVPASWLPPHCCTCRRIASQPITLYTLPCCASMHCCSADCWNEHAAGVHQQDPPKSAGQASTKRVRFATGEHDASIGVAAVDIRSNGDKDAIVDNSVYDRKEKDYDDDDDDDDDEFNEQEEGEDDDLDE